MSNVSKDPPRISIGLPVYNGENYLAEAIESILAQSYRDFELIISDNESTDGTEEICRAYAAQDSRVRYERQPRNLGAAPNYNLLVERAQGEFFKWAAHDDNLRPDFLARCVEALDHEPGAVLAYPRTVVIGDAGEEISEFHDGLMLMDDAPDARMAAYLKRNFLRRKGLCNPIFGVIRTELLRRTRMIQSFLESDNVLLAHFSLLGKFVEVDEILFERRVHSGISTLANRGFAGRQAWFDTSVKTKRRGRSFNNYVTMRLNHLRNIYCAIGELIDDANARRKCQWRLISLLIFDPKWLYIDIKYSLGFRPGQEKIAQRLQET